VRHTTRLMYGAGLLVWLYVGLLGSQAAGRTSEEEALYMIAVQAYQDSLWELARDQLQRYLATYPRGARLAEVHYLLGDYFYRKGEYPRAAEHMREALQRPLSETLRDDARYVLGRSQFESGRYQDALRTLQPLIQQGRSGRWYEAALYRTGEAFLHLHDFAGAARTLGQFVEQFPSSEYLEYALYSLGYARQQGNASEQALQAFERILQQFPHSPLRRSAAYGMAQALMSLDRYAEAALRWEHLRSEASTPDEAEEATFWWAENWAHAGRCDQARPAFDVYLEQFPQGRRRGDALATSGECAHSAGAFEPAIRRFEELLQQAPDDPRRETILLRLADAYQQTGQLPQAHQRYSQWLQAFPHNPRAADVLVWRGLISHVQGDDLGSAEDFAEVLRRTQDAAQQTLAHEMLAESYFRRNDCGAALPHLSAVIENGEASAQQQASLRRGVCAYRQQQYLQAINDLSPLVDTPDFHGDRQAILELLGPSLATMDRHEEAIARYRQFLATGPTQGAAADALASLGASLLTVGQVTEALTVYEQLLTQAPTRAGTERLHLQVGLLYRERQAWEQARAHFRAAATGRDQVISAEALYHLADLVLADGETEEGKALLQRLTTQFASQVRWVGIAHYRLALMYEETQGWPEAWKAYVAAATIATDPKLVEAARGRARHLEETVDVHVRHDSAPADAPRQ